MWTLSSHLQSIQTRPYKAGSNGEFRTLGLSYQLRMNHTRGEREEVNNYAASLRKNSS